MRLAHKYAHIHLFSGYHAPSVAGMEHRAPSDLPSLRAAFPAYEFSEDRRYDPVRYHARARSLRPTLYAIVTDNLQQLADALRQTTSEPVLAISSQAAKDGASPSLRR